MRIRIPDEVIRLYVIFWLPNTFPVTMGEFCIEGQIFDNSKTLRIIFFFKVNTRRFMMFEVAGGSVIGTDHRRVGRNRQDAFWFTKDQDVTLALVSDGCGSSRFSEVGAHLGVRLTANAILQRINSMKYRYSRELGLPGSESEVVFWESVRQDVLAQLRVLSLSLSTSVSTEVDEYFLFTIVGALLTKYGSVFFSLGDGVIIINGENIPLGSFPQNKPPYLAYGLLIPPPSNFIPEQLQFRIHANRQPGTVENFLIGTDGVTHLIHASGEHLPGREELVGTIDQYWREDRYFGNPEMVNRRLRLVNAEKLVMGAGNVLERVDHGLLPDDTTLIVGRSMKE